MSFCTCIICSSAHEALTAAWRAWPGHVDRTSWMSSQLILLGTGAALSWPPPAAAAASIALAMLSSPLSERLRQ